MVLDSRLDPGSMLATTHDAGGLRVKLRLARPSDALRVRAFLERQRPALADSARRFTFYDPRERLVLAATAPIEGVETVVGLVDTGGARPLVLAWNGDLADLLAAAARSLAERVLRAA
jgi:hypothetical protein